MLNNLVSNMTKQKSRDTVLSKHAYNKSYPLSVFSGADNASELVLIVLRLWNKMLVQLNENTQNTI